jgi:hypothetical protein
MAKRELTPKELKKQWDRERAQATRKAKRERFEAVLQKGKVEYTADFYGLFCGLSRKAIDNAAFQRIIHLTVVDGFTPREVIRIMEQWRRE